MLALSGDLDGTLETTRTPEVEIAGRVRLGFVEAEGSYEIRQAEAIFPDEVSFGVSRSNSCFPNNSSSPMTWRLMALCDTESAAAPPVKLRCWPTASKARSALSGSQRRLIALRLEIVAAPLLHFVTHKIPARDRRCNGQCQAQTHFDIGLSEIGIIRSPADRAFNHL